MVGQWICCFFWTTQLFLTNWNWPCSLQHEQIAITARAVNRVIRVRNTFVEDLLLHFNCDVNDQPSSWMSKVAEQSCNFHARKHHSHHLSQSRIWNRVERNQSFFSSLLPMSFSTSFDESQQQKTNGFALEKRIKKLAAHLSMKLSKKWQWLSCCVEQQKLLKSKKFSWVASQIQALLIEKISFEILKGGQSSKNLQKQRPAKNEDTSCMQQPTGCQAWIHRVWRPKQKQNSSASHTVTQQNFFAPSCWNTITTITCSDFQPWLKKFAFCHELDNQNILFFLCVLAANWNFRVFCWPNCTDLHGSFCWMALAHQPVVWWLLWKCNPQ